MTQTLTLSASESGTLLGSLDIELTGSVSGGGATPAPASVASVADRAALKALDPTDGQVVYVRQPVGAWFSYTSTSQTAGVTRDPRGAVFVVPSNKAANGSQGAWVMEGDWASGLDVRHFGLTGTDDRLALQAAVDFGTTLLFPEIVIPISGVVNVTKPITIRGIGRQKSEIRINGSYFALRVTAQVCFEDFAINNVADVTTLSDGAAIDWNALSGQSMTRRIGIYNHFVGMRHKNAPVITHDDIDIKTYKKYGIFLDSSQAGDFNYNVQIKGPSIISGQRPVNGVPTIYGEVGIYAQGHVDELVIHPGVIINYNQTGIMTALRPGAAYGGTAKPQFWKLFGVSIDMNTTGFWFDQCFDILLQGCFVSSRGNGGIVGNTTPGARARNVRFVECCVFNCDFSGIAVLPGAEGTVVRGGAVKCNSVSGTGYGLYIENNVNDFEIDGVFFSNVEEGFNGVQEHHIAIVGGNHTRYKVTNCTFQVAGISPMRDDTTGSPVRFIANNT